MVNTYLADRRRKRIGEVLTDNLPERAVQPQTPETRIVVVDALAALPPRARAVRWPDFGRGTVLRYQGAAVLSAAFGEPGLMSRQLQLIQRWVDSIEQQTRLGDGEKGAEPPGGG